LREEFPPAEEGIQRNLADDPEEYSPIPEQFLWPHLRESFYLNKALSFEMTQKPVLLEEVGTRLRRANNARVE